MIQRQVVPMWSSLSHLEALLPDMLAVIDPNAI